MVSDYKGRPTPSFMDMFPAHTVGVLDTDLLFDAVVQDTEGSRISSLGMTLLSKSITWVASSHVYHEMYQAEKSGSELKTGFINKFDKMSEQAKIRRNLDVPAEAYRRTFEDNFLPFIRFVEMPGNETHPWRQHIPERGRSDWPTAQLTALVAPATVHSLNKRDLDKFMPSDVQAVSKAGEAVSAFDGLCIGASILIFATGAGGVEASKGIGKVLKIPPWPAGIGLLAFVIWAFADPGRRQKVNQFTAPILHIAYSVAQQGLEADGLFRKEEILPLPNPSLAERIGQLLIRSSTPLLAKEIHEKLVLAQGTATYSLAEVRSILADHPAFLHPPEERFRWQLGSCYLPKLSVDNG